MNSASNKDSVTIPETNNNSVSGAEPGSLTPTDSCSLAPGLNTAKDDELETLVRNLTSRDTSLVKSVVREAIQTYATNQTIEVLEGLKNRTEECYDIDDGGEAFDALPIWVIDATIKELKERL